jgi:hypothetical protein
MPRRTLATGAAAALLTGAVFFPVIVRQREKIAALEHQLAATKDPADPTANPARAIPDRPTDSRPAPQRLPTRRSEYEEQQARYEPVKDKVTAWKDAAMQMDDAARKQQALDEILTALSSSNDEEIFAALSGYGSVSQVEFDRSAFRPAIVALLEHADPMIRRTALGFIAALPPDEGDLARVTAMARDSDEGVRKGVVASLFWLTKRDLSGEAGDTVLGILNLAKTPSRSLIDTMWGARMTPELERKLVEFARAPSQPNDEELAYYAVYSCLSTQNNKGPDCVDLLIERLGAEDSYNVGARAAWGLAYGVQPGLGLEKKIADAALKVWRNRSNPYLRQELMKSIRQYGDATHADELEEIAAAPAIGEEQRKLLSQVATELRQRPGSPAADDN